MGSQGFWGSAGGVWPLGGGRCSSRSSPSPSRSASFRGIARLALTAWLALGLPGCIHLDLFPQRQGLQETVVYGQAGPKILLLDIDGVIRASEERRSFGGGSESTVARVRETLDRARKDDAVVAVILRIDTPGGGVTASELVYREILRFKRERGLPVVAQLMGTATSGGYYVAMAADRVVAHRTTVTGSIGVIFLGVNVSGLMQKLGIQNQTLTAGLHKDAGSPLRAMTGDERAQLQSILDDLHARFREVVALGRPGLDRARVDALADGRIYSASQALEVGLVDRLGALEDTVEALRQQLGEPQVRVVSYHRSREWRRNLYTQPPGPPPAPSVNLDLGSFLGPLGEPGFHYLWWPGSG